MQENLILLSSVIASLNLMYLYYTQILERRRIVMIRKDGPADKPHCVYTHDGKKKLGCHKTHGEAVIQLKAIEASKAAKAKGGGGK